MESFAEPIRRLIDTLSWFVRAQEFQLLYVSTSADLRSSVVRLCRSQELHPYNRSPFVLLEDPFTSLSEGWLEGIERLREQHEVRRARMAEEGEALPGLPARPDAKDPVVAFGLQLAQLLQVRAPWHEGMIAIMAPSRVETPRAYGDRLRMLMETKGLEAVRWILIDANPHALDPLTVLLGDRAQRVDCRVDAEKADRDLARMLDSAESAPPDISGPARVGAAWPRGISPPPRRNRPPADPEQIDELLKREGLSLPLAGSKGNELSREVLRAAQALRRNDAALAVQHQARARDLCVAAGLSREAILMDLVLGAYLIAAGNLKLAAETYSGASTRAEKHAMGDLAAQANMALGALHLRQGEHDDAVLAYLRGAASAKEAGIGLVAIEGLRVAGQIKLDEGNEREAGELWAGALSVADALPQEEARVSSAAEVARALAILCRRQGKVEQAVAFEGRSY